MHKHMCLSQTEKKNLKQLQEYESLQWFQEVSKLKEGASFGEHALICDEPRSATIACLSECKFATLEKQEYLKILKRIDK